MATAAADHEGELIIGFEEGMSFLPSQIVDEACDTKVSYIILYIYIYVLFINISIGLN